MEQIIEFANRNKLREWLIKNHSQPESIWILFTKKNKQALQHNEALEEALCFGWIDSQIKSVDDIKYKIKFSKRRKNSIWSERNKTFVQKLIQSGLMTEYGIAEIEKAKANGKWDQEINSQELISDEILKEKLKAFDGIIAKYEMLSPSNKKFFTLYYLNAKRDETKAKRLLTIVDHIEKGERIF